MSFHQKRVEAGLIVYVTLVLYVPFSLCIDSAVPLQYLKFKVLRPFAGVD